MELKIGADPELFLKQGNKFVSGYGIIPGTKENPHPVPDGAVQVDGMALEFNIDPATDADTFCHNINSVLASLRDMVPTEYDLTLVPTARFEREHMAAQPEEALVLGCEPDWCAYGMQQNPRPEAPPNMRTAAGHVHVGWTNGANVDDELHMETCGQMARQLDVFLGIPSLFEDNDNERRAVYGQAGAFRPKPYGMEYRVLSNYWVHNDEMIHQLWNRVHRAVDNLRNQNHWVDSFRDRWNIDVQKTINEVDMDAAERIYHEVQL